MIFVRDIRLPLSAPQGQAVESALKTLRLSHRLVEGAEISKISVDARHGSPRLVYTVAVTLKDKGAETYSSSLGDLTIKNTDGAVKDLECATLANADTSYQYEVYIWLEGTDPQCYNTIAQKDGVKNADVKIDL